jgi:endonuclease-3
MKNDILKKRANEIIKKLALEYPDSKPHLEFNNPFELLISTVLAAQCTDVRVNMTMPPLYKTKYKSPKDILKDGIDNFRQNIKSISFPNSKAKSIIALCRQLVDDFNGQVPKTMEELTKLTGVGRKSASVVLGNCFGKKDVIIVDTHFKRVTTRLGLTENDDPEKIEMDLKEIIPPDEQFKFSLRIGDHGRTICDAKKPKCAECMFNKSCPAAKL